MRNPVHLQIEGDVLLAASFSDTLLRLSGDDGSTAWSVDHHGFGSIASFHRSADGNVIVIGSSRWGKIDFQTGAVVWDAVAPAESCAPAWCSIPRTLELPDGSLLQVGYKSGATGFVADMLAHLHVDGSGTFELWFPEEGALLRPEIMAIASDSSGQVWTEVRERLPGTSLRMRSLAKFNLHTGAFDGRQVLLNYSTNVHTRTLYTSQWLSAPELDRLPVRTYVHSPPTPTHHGVAVLDTTATQAGNLSVDAMISSALVMAGERVAFQVNARYNGTESLSDAGVDIVLPWGSEADDLRCLGASANACAFDTRDGDVHVTFLIASGEEIRIYGTVRALDTANPTPVFNATVYGPTGLLEQDTNDNFLALPITQSLFHADFEP